MYDLGDSQDSNISLSGNFPYYGRTVVVPILFTQRMNIKVTKRRNWIVVCSNENCLKILSTKTVELFLFNVPRFSRKNKDKIRFEDMR